MPDNISVFIVPFLAALFAFFGNILYFNFSTNKKEKKKILEKQIKELLQPLYLIFIEDDLLQSEYFKNENLDVAEYFAEQMSRVAENIKPVLLENLYLADEKLQSCCVNFLKESSSIDEREEFDKLMSDGYCCKKTLSDLKSEVLKQYEEKRKEYLRY